MLVSQTNPVEVKSFPYVKTYFLFCSNKSAQLLAKWCVKTLIMLNSLYLDSSSVITCIERANKKTLLKYSRSTQARRRRSSCSITKASKGEKCKLRSGIERLVLQCKVWFTLALFVSIYYSMTERLGTKITALIRLNL